MLVFEKFVLLRFKYFNSYSATIAIEMSSVVQILKPICQHINSGNKNNGLVNENKSLTIFMSVLAICSVVACINKNNICCKVPEQSALLKHSFVLHTWSLR